MADDEDADDDDGDACEADVPLPQRLLRVPAAAVPPQLLAADHGLVAAEGAVDEAVEHDEQAGREEEVHQPVGDVHVDLRQERELCVFNVYPRDVTSFAMARFF